MDNLRLRVFLHESFTREAHEFGVFFGVKFGKMVGSVHRHILDSVYFYQVGFMLFRCKFIETDFLSDVFSRLINLLFGVFP